MSMGISSASEESNPQMNQLSPLRQKLYRIVMLLVMSPLFLGCLVLDHWTYVQYRMGYYGQDYQGEVTGKMESRRRLRRRTASCFMSYAFEVEGQRQTGSEFISRTTYDKLVVPLKDAPGENVYVRAVKVGSTYYSTAGFSQFR